MGITGLPMKLIQSFLNNRLQRVVLNGQTSAWTPVLAGVPQGSNLGRLFFLIYINDLVKGHQLPNYLLMIRLSFLLSMTLIYLLTI